MGRPKNTPESFWRKVQRSGSDDCWLWTASIRNGYGNHTVDKATYYAHRYAYELTNGRPPTGHFEHVMHKCNNKLCCNPSHLILGTAAENTQSAFRDGLATAGQRHHRAKFSADLIDKIRNDPRPQLELERVYGVSQQHISRIKSGQSRMYEAVNG